LLAVAVVVVVVAAFPPMVVLALLVLVLVLMMLDLLVLFARPGLICVAVSARVIAVFTPRWRLVGVILPVTMVRMLADRCKRVWPETRSGGGS
jgi:hypothetical protein